MATYAIVITTTLVNHLRQSLPDISQVWFADDATAAGKLALLLQWWKLHISQGLMAIIPMHAYLPYCQVILQQYFQGSNVQITCLGH